MIPWIAVGSALAAALLWGIEPVLQKYAMRDIETETYYLMVGIPLLIVWCGFMLWHHKKIVHDVQHNNALTLRNILLIGAIVVFFGALPQYIYLKLLKGHPSHVIAGITATFPMFTLLVSCLVFRRHVHRDEVIGIILITVGIMLLVYRNPELFAAK